MQYRYQFTLFYYQHYRAIMQTGPSWILEFFRWIHFSLSQQKRHYDLCCLSLAWCNVWHGTKFYRKRICNGVTCLNMQCESEIMIRMMPRILEEFIFFEVKVKIEK